MAIDHRLGTKVVKSLRTDEAPGVRVDPYPYIGIVKNNLDPIRAGRLQVWIPELGGLENDVNSWRTINYSSPYMGTTNIQPRGGKASPDNNFKNVPHSYGMWMVPPDLETEIICIFIGGDPLRGYMIGCVNSNLSRHMMPGIASSTNVDTSGASSDTKNSYKDGTPVPVAEFNEYDPSIKINPLFVNNKKPIHEHQYSILKKEGLDRDPYRGTITSSSQRESPSNVFGISTPGRPDPDPADNASSFLEKLAGNKLEEKDYVYKTRKGGHTFVMDDGNVVGKDQLVRLRTAKGHQIMMHDTANSLYISHADGTSWVELSADGSIHIFANNGINVRSAGTINMHSDKDINFNAQNILMHSAVKTQIDTDSKFIVTAKSVLVGSGTIEFKASSAFNVQSQTLSLNASGGLVLAGSSINQNSGGGASVTSPKAIVLNGLPNTEKDGTGLYQSKSGKIQSIVTVAPCHEPFIRAGEATSSSSTGNNSTVIGASQAPAKVGTPPEKYTGTIDNTKNTSGGVKTPAGANDILNQPPATKTIGSLSKDETTALLAQLAKSESGGYADPYSVKNQLGYVGKYQMGAPALKTLGYVKMSASNNNASLQNPNNWTGKDGINSVEDYYAAHDTQEAMVVDLANRNYAQLSKSGGITKQDGPAEVGGMLMTAHLLGGGGANQWRKGNGGVDANGTTGQMYFDRGKYAVAVLAPKVTESKTG